MYELREWMQDRPSFDIASVDEMTRAIDTLVKREWAEWHNEHDVLFNFKLGIFPLWILRSHIEFGFELKD